MSAFNLLRTWGSRAISSLCKTLPLKVGERPEAISFKKVDHSLFD